MNGDGRLAIVTGASSGIGFEFAKALGGKGWNLLMVSDRERDLTECAGIIRKEYGVKADTLCLDLSREDSVEIMENHLMDNGAPPHLLVNNAGIFDFTTVDNLPDERIRLYINLHILTLTLLCKRIAKMMEVNGVRGYILNMSSMSCWMPMPGIALYSATKAYIRVMSRALGVELADKGISVTVACPGGIATGLFGLSPKLLKLGVRLGVLATPDKFTTKALKRTFRRRRQYINGFLNRISIVIVALAPYKVRRMLKHKLLDRKSR